MLLDVNFLSRLVPRTPLTTLTTFVNLFNKHAPKYGINTKERIASFVGNCIVESGLQPIVEANGNRKYLISTYWDRIHKRNEFEYKSPQDAIDYSGKGYIQLTGIPNYRMASFNIFGDDRLVKNPSLVLQPDISMQTSFEWWRANNMNAVSDKYGIVGVASKINTGSPTNSKALKHKTERLAAYNSILSELKKKIKFPNRPVFASINKHGLWNSFIKAIKK